MRKSPKTLGGLDFFEQGKHELDLLERMETVKEERAEKLRGNPQAAIDNGNG